MTTPADLHIREATVDDFDRYFDEGFDELSPGSRLTRFFSVMPTLPEAVRRSLRELDGSTHVAVVGFAADHVDDHHPEGKPVGVARWIAGGDELPELAVTVLDEFQGQGVGTRLVRALCDLAASRGFTEMVAYVMVENTPMHRILQHAGARVIPGEEPGVTAYVLPTS